MYAESTNDWTDRKRSQNPLIYNSNNPRSCVLKRGGDSIIINLYL